MSSMGTARLNAKRDKNEPIIVDALRAAGCLVHRISGTGVPDLLVWSPFVHAIVLLEVKDGARRPSERKLKPDQEAFHSAWCAAGAPVFKVINTEEAFVAVGMRGAA